MKRLSFVGTLAMALWLLLLSSCSSDDNANAPDCTLDISFGVVSSAATGQSVTPNNLSLEAASYTWDFGDGTTVVRRNSFEAPSHIYTQAGTYTITLNGYCGSGQTGKTATFSQDITISQSNPTLSANPQAFTKLSDGFLAYPVGIPFLISLEGSAQVNEVVIEWGDNTTEVFSAQGLSESNFLISHTYATVPDTILRIAITGYELADQEGLSDEFIFELEIQRYHQIQISSLTLHPALGDSLGAARWENGSGNEGTSELGTEADLVLWSYDFQSDTSLDATSFIPLTNISGDFGLKDLAPGFSSDIIEPIATLTGNSEWNIYVPQEPWDKSLNPLFIGRSAYLKYASQLSVLNLSEIDQDGGLIALFPLLSISERSFSVVSPTQTALTIADDDFRPLVTFNFTVREIEN